MVVVNVSLKVTKAVDSALSLALPCAATQAACASSLGLCDGYADRISHLHNTLLTPTNGHCIALDAVSLNVNNITQLKQSFCPDHQFVSDTM